MSGKSEAVVGFIANLLPLYDGERHEGVCCARSLIDGTLIFPIDESESEDEQGSCACAGKVIPLASRKPEATCSPA